MGVLPGSVEDLAGSTVAARPLPTLSVSESSALGKEFSSEQLKTETKVRLRNLDGMFPPDHLPFGPDDWQERFETYPGLLLGVVEQDPAAQIPALERVNRLLAVEPNGMAAEWFLDSVTNIAAAAELTPRALGVLSTIADRVGAMRQWKSYEFNEEINIQLHKISEVASGATGKYAGDISTTYREADFEPSQGEKLGAAEALIEESGLLGRMMAEAAKSAGQAEGFFERHRDPGKVGRNVRFNLYPARLLERAQDDKRVVAKALRKLDRVFDGQKPTLADQGQSGELASAIADWVGASFDSSRPTVEDMADFTGHLAKFAELAKGDRLAESEVAFLVLKVMGESGWKKSSQSEAWSEARNNVEAIARALLDLPPKE